MADEKTFTQSDFDKLQKQIADLNEKLEAEAAKTQRAVDEAKVAKAEARKLKEIDPADLEKLEAENDKLRTDLAAAQKQAKDATTAAEKAKQALEAESGFTSKLLVQDGIKSALIAAGVKDEDYLDALTTKFSTGANVVAEGDARIARIGDKAVADVIKEWAASDAGKKFVAAPVNGGGGASGGNGGGNPGVKTVTRAEFDGMDHMSRMTFSKEGGKVVDQAA
jgi:hypothetical protein